ncbi:PA2169 family four-helix-bundle protein [Sphingobacterium sp. lm-10]|uniref:PA2169 family four-helix-bundle protein n=1 Tax=Sphingobacterium sp. lm-10 TaxID=2944904 RepID=UPI002021E939|nr:PA2169 family four-helix-bundle protein [Sphingobacterium sp. lm-10]MCL7987469.1 PA2169 family four-helix-bundle protein [Sphingobacterium sp. lm-10]
MQYNNKECVDLLKRLISANKDRIAGYSEAIQQLNTDSDADLILEFEHYVQESQQFKAQLTPLVYREGDSESEYDAPRIIFTQAADAEQATSHRESVLQACEQAEKELQHIYKEVNGYNEIIDEHIKDMIKSQSDVQQESYITIANLLENEKSN